MRFYKYMVNNLFVAYCLSGLLGNVIDCNVLRLCSNIVCYIFECLRHLCVARLFVKVVMISSVIKFVGIFEEIDLSKPHE